MTGLGHFCLVALAGAALQRVRRGQASAPIQSAEQTRNAALHSSARPSDSRISGRNVHDIAPEPTGAAWRDGV
jgi:hypothetical protein